MIRLVDRVHCPIDHREQQFGLIFESEILFDFVQNPRGFGFALDFQTDGISDSDDIFPQNARRNVAGLLVVARRGQRQVRIFSVGRQTGFSFLRGENVSRWGSRFRARFREFRNSFLAGLVAEFEKSALDFGGHGEAVGISLFETVDDAFDVRVACLQKLVIFVVVNGVVPVVIIIIIIIIIIGIAFVSTAAVFAIAAAVQIAPQGISGGPGQSLAEKAVENGLQEAIARRARRIAERRRSARIFVGRVVERRLGKGPSHARVRQGSLRQVDFPDAVSAAELAQRLVEAAAVAVVRVASASESQSRHQEGAPSAVIGSPSGAIAGSRAGLGRHSLEELQCSVEGGKRGRGITGGNGGRGRPRQRMIWRRRAGVGRRFRDIVTVSGLDVGFLSNGGIVRDGECHDDFSYVDFMFYDDVSLDCQ